MESLAPNATKSKRHKPLKSPDGQPLGLAAVFYAETWHSSYRQPLFPVLPYSLFFPIPYSLYPVPMAQ